MRESIMDMDLSERIREIQKEEGRVNHGPINIAGPAGNPTQPGYTDEHRSGVIVSGPNAYCSDCGAKHGLGHFISCKQAQLTDDYYCGFKPSWVELIAQEAAVMSELLAQVDRARGRLAKGCQAAPTPAP